jgi:hypothetical protein
MVFIGGVRRCCGQRLGAWGPLDRLASHATWLGGQVSSLHCLSHIGYSAYWLALTRDENRFWKCANTWSAGQGDGAGWPHLGSVEPVLYAMSFPHVILSVTMSYFGHNEDMHGFWSIWCFFIIRCSWNGRSTKLVELISNRHLSSISWMKCRYVGGKYMYFMTANTPPTHTHLEFCSSLSKRKELNPGDISKNSSAITAWE